MSGQVEGGDGISVMRGGDFIYIEPGVPHEVFNLSENETAVAVIARSAADEWEQTIPYDRHAAFG